MHIHSDFSQPVVIDTGALDWCASPLPGVERRMLERIGDEVARATSLVRYAPGSVFPAHTHERGEEFLVLDGVFSDELGHYPRGFYVRNPPGSRHRPYSIEGATIFVKLRQMRADDTAQIRIDTVASRLWQTALGGVRVLPLFAGPDEQVDLLEWSAPYRAARATWPGGAEYFVLHGEFSDEYGTHPAGAWLRLPPGAGQTVDVGGGVLLYRKTGHLRAVGPCP
ncbi:MAG: cupin domain-containing protein [Acidiferrobacter sp.]